jgi:predicted phage terminase large subunit-like protein
MFLSTAADIAITGGGAGGGKSWSLLMEPLRHAYHPDFNATFFRRTFPQIRNPGGLWDASMELYPLIGAVPKESSLRWIYPGGGYAVMRHLKLEKDVLNWQGTELVYVAMDELTHFTEYQFWYITSRLRSTSGIRPYLRASCNPDPDSFVRLLLDWWIDDDGFPIPERSGQLRHFVREDNTLTWHDEPTEETQSLTFIPSLVYDNPALLQKDPTYLRRLKGLTQVERDRLLGGNWNVKPVAGKVFKSHWLEVVSDFPIVKQWVRFWDFAATEKALKGQDPDWTVGVLMGLTEGNKVLIRDVFRDRLGPDQVERAVVNTARQDGVGVSVRWFRDPGQAGNFQTSRLRSLTAGFDSMGVSSPLDKMTRARPLARAAEFGEVMLLKGDWNTVFINELINFPDGAHDDQVDAGAGAYQALTGEGVAHFGQARYR